MIVLKFKAITKLSVFLFIAAFMSSAQASPRPPAKYSMNGLWKVFSTNSLDNSTVQGTLRIKHDLMTDSITATSTSGGSRWTGHFDQSSHVLKASFRNGQIHGKIYLKFVLGQPSTLSGKWFSGSKDKGIYKAMRMTYQ